MLLLLVMTGILTGCSRWNLVWSDEFSGTSGSSLDPSKWVFDTGGQGWGNQELEYYTDKSQNASLDGGGNLVITAQQEADPATSGLSCWYGPCKYTSARITTGKQFDFTYGRVEARIKLPAGKGIWPAFWLLGADCSKVGYPACGEIDIMEENGGNSSIIHATVHGPGNSGPYSIENKLILAPGSNFPGEYHLFAVDWKPDSIQWYYDGRLYAELTKSQLPDGDQWVFDHPFVIILNLAVGGTWLGNPDQSTHFPKQMYVDYVRVYEMK